MSERRDGAEEENMKLGKTFISSVFKHAVVCVCMCVYPPSGSNPHDGVQKYEKINFAFRCCCQQKKAPKNADEKVYEKSFFDGID